MADLLAAASLLLTVTTILYSLWYTEINEASKRDVKKLGANRNKDYSECHRVLAWKTTPLCIVAVGLLAINLPDATEIIRHAFEQLHAVHAARYDAVRTTFVAVYLVLAFLTGHTVKAFVTLAVHVFELNPKRGDYK